MDTHKYTNDILCTYSGHFMQLLKLLTFTIKSRMITLTELSNMQLYNMMVT